MIQRGFLKEHRKTNSRENRFAPFAGRLMFYLGAIILILALSYLIVNFAKADVLVNIWFPFMTAGVLLTFMSFIFRKKNTRK